MENYILLDCAASELMKKSSGICTYITALERQKLDTGASETLIFLKKCKSARNKLAHDPGAIKENAEITRKDIAKIKKLTSLMKKSKDPLSRIVKKKKADKAKKIKTALFVLSVAVLVAVAIILNKK